MTSEFGKASPLHTCEYSVLSIAALYPVTFVIARCFCRLVSFFFLLFGKGMGTGVKLLQSRSVSGGLGFILAYSDDSPLRVDLITGFAWSGRLGVRGDFLFRVMFRASLQLHLSLVFFLPARQAGDAEKHVLRDHCMEWRRAGIRLGFVALIILSSQRFGG